MLRKIRRTSYVVFMLLISESLYRITFNPEQAQFWGITFLGWISVFVIVAVIFLVIYIWIE